MPVRWSNAITGQRIPLPKRQKFDRVKEELTDFLKSRRVTKQCLICQGNFVESPTGPREGRSFCKSLNRDSFALLCHVTCGLSLCITPVELVRLM